MVKDNVKTLTVLSIDCLYIVWHIFRMAKKQPAPKSKLFNFRCDQEELEEFRQCAEREGFNSVSAWLLWHLRQVVRDSNSKPH